MRKGPHPRDRFRALACVCGVLLTSFALLLVLTAAMVDASGLRVPGVAVTGAAALAWLASEIEGVGDWRAVTAGTRAKRFGFWYTIANLAALLATAGGAVALAMGTEQVALLPLGCLALAVLAGAGTLALCVVIRNDLAAAARLRRGGALPAITLRAKNPD